MALAWLWLDVPTFLWWSGRASIGQMLRSPLGFLSTNRHIDHVWAGAWYFVGVGLLLLSYQPFIEAWESRTRKPWHLALLLLLLASASFPFVSHDLFSYFGEWRTMAIYHRNPMITPVATISHWRSDLWLVRAGWQRTVNPYGPVWFGLVDLLGRLAPTGFVGFFVVWKATVLLSTLLTGLLVNRLRPGTGIRYLLHPVVGIEFLANAHNDVIMMSLAVASFFLWTRRRWVAAGVCAGLSVATKYITLLALGWLVVWPEAWKSRVKVAIPALAVGVLSLVPFWHGLATLAGTLDATHLFLRSPAFIIQGTLVHLLHMPRVMSRHWAIVATTLLFFCIYVATSLRFWRTQDPIYMGDALLAAALIFMSWLQFWYLGWALPFYLTSAHARAQTMVRYLAYLEIVRVVGWPFGLPVILQIAQVFLIWTPVGWGLWKLWRGAEGRGRYRPWQLLGRGNR